MQLKLMLGVMVAAMAAGCTLPRPQYGDGRAGPVALDPLVESFAATLDKQAPGTGAGDRVRGWFATASLERVPPGYEIEWEAFLDGLKIDESRIQRIPRLRVKNPSAPVVVVEPAADQDDPLTELGGLLKGKPDGQ